MVIIDHSYTTCGLYCTQSNLETLVVESYKYVLRLLITNNQTLYSQQFLQKLAEQLKLQIQQELQQK
jgi:hypothetical protein